MSSNETICTTQGKYTTQGNKQMLKNKKGDRTHQLNRGDYNWGHYTQQEHIIQEDVIWYQKIGPNNSKNETGRT